MRNVLVTDDLTHYNVSAGINPIVIYFVIAEVNIHAQKHTHRLVDT